MSSKSVPSYVVLLSTLVLAAPGARAAPRAAPPLEVNGTVLASFDEDHAIINTGDKLVRISTRQLTFLQRQKLARLPLTISLKVPASAVDLVWSLEPKPDQAPPVARLEPPTKVMERLNSHDGIVELRGRRIPSGPSEAAFVQVNDTVYVIQRSKVPAESRSRLDQAEVEAYLPQGSVLFAWKIDTGRVSSEPGERHELRMEGNNLRIVGRSLYSFEDPYSLVQSDESVVQLRRGRLSLEQQRQLDRIGSTVRLRVPKETVNYLWSVKHEDLAPRPAQRLKVE